MLEKFVKKIKKSPQINLAKLKDRNTVKESEHDKKTVIIDNKISKSEKEVNNLEDDFNESKIIMCSANFDVQKNKIKKSQKNKKISKKLPEGNASLLEDFNFKIKNVENVNEKNIEQNNLTVDSQNNFSKNLTAESQNNFSKNNSLKNSSTDQKRNDFHEFFSETSESFLECDELNLEKPNANKFNLEKPNANELTLQNIVQTTTIFAEEPITPIFNMKFNQDDTIVDNNTLESRKAAIINNATREIQIPYNLINSSIYFPENFKKLSELYKILTIIYEFNQKRNLKLVFCKYKKSIERMFKHRVELIDLERINYLLSYNIDDEKNDYEKNFIQFTPVKINENGEKTSTFTISIPKKADFDQILFSYLLDRYKQWLLKNPNEKFFHKFHSAFLENISIPTKKFLKEEVIKKVVIEEAVSKANNIFDRIKEKEKLKKENFVKERLELTSDIRLERKIDDIFAISGKKAIKFTELIFRLDGFDTKKRIESVFAKNYETRIIGEEKYVIKK